MFSVSSWLWLVVGIVVLGFAPPAVGATPVLHVGNSYDSCYFDLHPELTQGQFRTFAAEGGAVVRFLQLAAADTLGKGTFEVSMNMSATRINDAKGAWNNTFSHPDAEHWLGDVQQFPRLVVRAGVTDYLDVGAWGSVNPLSNYGFVGVDAKLALLQRRQGAPVDLAVRPSVTTVLGPSELWFGNVGVDLTVSRDYSGLSPYVGVGGTASLAIERSNDVDLSPAFSVRPVALVGLAYDFHWFSAGAEAVFSDVHSAGVHAGGTF